jgi:tripartite-type tricarboxylate transporter receptor subunit TctC
MLEAFFGRYKMARPLALPPGVPAERVAAIRAAFDATMKDPEFLAEARQLKLDIDPTGGEAMQIAVKQIDTIPQATIDRLRGLLKR